MAATGHEWALTIQGAEQDIPRLLSLKRVGGGAEVVYKATPEGAACLLASEKGNVWAWQHKHGAAPVTPTAPFQAGEAVALLAHVEPGPKSEPVHKGTWRGTFRVSDHGPVVTLIRKVATHIQIVITSDPRGSAGATWDVKVERDKTWWGPQRNERGTAKPGSLAAAMREGYAIAGGLSGEVCGVRETTRREALDQPFAAKRKEVQAAKDAARPPSLRARSDDATAGWLAKLHVPVATRQPGYAGFPAAEGRMEAVLGYLRAQGHNVAAAALQGWHKGIVEGKTKAPRALGDVVEAAANLLRAKYGGKRPKGSQVEDYNNAVSVLGTLLGGVVPPRLQMQAAPTCSSSVAAVAESAAAEARAIDRELDSTWATAKTETPWDDWRTALLRRTASLIDKACALVRSPLCQGEARADAVRTVRTAMDAYDRFRSAAMAESGGRRAARAKVLPVEKRQGHPPVHAVQLVEGPEKGRTVTLTPLQESTGLVVPGATVFVHYEPSLMLGAVAGLRLDSQAQGRELAYGDSVRTLRYLAETAALAATRAAKACAGAPSKRFTAAGASCPSPGGHTPSAPAAVYQCGRCGFVAPGPVLHLAIGSVLCPAGTGEFNLLAHPTPAQLREVAEAGRWTVREEDPAADPVPLPLPVAAATLSALPVGSVVVGFEPHHPKWPALAIRIGKANEDRWGQWSMATETVQDKQVGTSAQLSGILSDGRFTAVYLLVNGRGRLDNPWTSKAVARALAKLPEAKAMTPTTEEHARGRAEAKVNRAAREAIAGKPYAEWGKAAWKAVADQVAKVKGGPWSPKHGGKKKWIKSGSIPGTGSTPGVVLQIVGDVASGDWWSGWKVAGMEELAKLGPYPDEATALRMLVEVLRNGGSVRDTIEAARAPSPPAPADAAPSSRTPSDKPARKAKPPKAAAPSSLEHGDGGASSPPGKDARKPRKAAAPKDVDAKIGAAVGSALDALAARLMGAAA